MKYSSALKLNLAVIMVILAVLAVSYLVVNIAFGEEGGYIRVEKDGELVGEYPLDEDRDIRVPGEKFDNLIVIRDKKAFMKEASCPDHLCIKQGQISGAGQSIVCLPNRVIVTVIKNRDGNDTDVMVQ